MPDYRRLYIPGGTFFFMVTLKNRTSDVLTANIDALRQSWRDVRVRRPFETPAAVVLPDHTHFMMTWPEGDHDYSTRIRLIKAGFTKRLPQRHASAAGSAQLVVSRSSRASSGAAHGAVAGASPGRASGRQARAHASAAHGAAAELCEGPAEARHAAAKTLGFLTVLPVGRYGHGPARATRRSRAGPGLTGAAIR